MQTLQKVEMTKAKAECGEGTEKWAGSGWPCWCQKYFAWKAAFEDKVYGMVGLSNEKIEKATKSLQGAIGK